MFIRTEFQAEEDIADILEDSFDTCSTNRDELYWLITLLRGFMNIPNKRKDPIPDNYSLNQWQKEMFPVLERYKRKYCCSTFNQGDVNCKEDDPGETRGKHWFNNGEIQVFQENCPDGFKEGMLSFNKRKENKKSNKKWKKKKN